MQDILIGRQPIYNGQLGVCAYELILRGQGVDTLSDEANATSAQIVLNAFMEIGVERLVGSHKAAVPAPMGLLLQAAELPFDPRRIILDVPARVALQAAARPVLQDLSERGFSLILRADAKVLENAAVLALADTVKIDTQAMEPAVLAELMVGLRPLGKHLLADKVKDLRAFEFYLKLGFDFFQGYFLSHPRYIKGEGLATNRLSVLRFLGALHSSDTPTRELESIVGQDAALSYKLLKLTNSAFFGLPRKVVSIGQALALLGRKRLAMWGAVLALSMLDDRPNELMGIALTRAKMCERLAEKAGYQPIECYFAGGLFSALDLLMQRPLAELLEPLPLSALIKNALLNNQGSLGEALRCTLAYETSLWDEVKFAGLDREACTEAYVDAVKWSDEVLHTV